MMDEVLGMVVWFQGLRCLLPACLQGFRSPSARSTPGYHESPFQGSIPVATQP